LSEKETKAGMTQYCCDGLPKGYALSSNEVGKYAVIVDPEDYLTKACGAFDANCSMAGAHVGKKAEILSVDQDNRQATAFVPHAQDVNIDAGEQRPAETRFTFPFFALRKSWGVSEKIVRFGLDNPFDRTVTGHSTADGYTGLITRSNDEKVPKGWFINLAQYSRVNVPRWNEWSIGVRGSFGTAGGVFTGNRSIWISDEPKLPDQNKCTSFPFKDRGDNAGGAYGSDCGNYTRGNWCTDHARSTPAGCAVWNDPKTEDCDLPGGEDENGNNLGSYGVAGYQCCTCGGGNFEDPSVANGAEEIFF